MSLQLSAPAIPLRLYVPSSSLQEQERSRQRAAALRELSSDSVLLSASSAGPGNACKGKSHMGSGRKSRLMKTVQTMKSYGNYQNCTIVRPHIPHSSYGTYVTLAPKVLVFPVFVQVSAAGSEVLRIECSQCPAQQAVSELAAVGWVQAVTRGGYISPQYIP